MIARVREDIATAMADDPAARSRLETFCCYPGLHALWAHRLAHRLWCAKFCFAARLLAHFSRFITGIEIHPAAKIGRRVFIDHGMGVVIGQTSVIEDDVIIYKGVLLGGTTYEKDIRHPWIEPGVVIGSNACILGAIVVGRDSKIGSGSIVIDDVPEGATVVGVPGKAVRKKSGGALEHADLPDPVARALAELTERIAALEAKNK